MISKCSNGKHFIISNRSTVHLELDDSWVPCVVLLTAWSLSSSSTSTWSTLIEFLLDKGAKYFVCIGTYSEKLHDEIDDLLYRYDDERKSEISVNIITTYHVNDTLEEAVDYCVYGTELTDKNNSCILAILDADSLEDNKVKEFLEKA